jgi:hypothetical protein
MEKLRCPKIIYKQAIKKKNMGQRYLSGFLLLKRIYFLIFIQKARII